MGAKNWVLEGDYIILDNTDAADLIPKDARGRFLLHDGTIFQAYRFEESDL